MQFKSLLIWLLIGSGHLYCMVPEGQPMEIEESTETQPTSIASIPNEILALVLPYLSNTLDFASSSLQELRLVDKRFKAFIDDPKNTWNLIKFLSEKFKSNPVYTASRLHVPSAKKIYNKFFGSIQQSLNIIAIPPNIMNTYRSSILSAYLKQGTSFIIPIFLYIPYKYLQYDPSTPNHLILMRLLSNGTFDNNNFGIPSTYHPSKRNGFASIYLPHPTIIQEPFAFAVDQNMRILFACTNRTTGRANEHFEYRLIMSRFDPNGEIDKTWATNGLLSISLTELRNIIVNMGIELPPFVSVADTLADLSPQKITVQNNGTLIVMLKLKINEIGIYFALPLTANGNIDIAALKPGMVRTYVVPPREPEIEW